MFHLQNDLRARQWAISYHRHDFAEVFWIYTGRAIHHVNGQRQELKPGHVVFMRPEDAHTIELVPAAPLGFVNVAFPMSTLHALQRRYFGRDRRWFWSRAALPETAWLEPARLTRLQEWADGLVNAPRSLFEIERFLLNLIHLISNGVGREQRLPVEAPDWLASACAQMRERTPRQEGVAAWVRLCGRSPEHVARVTRQWLGMSPTDYVNELRLVYLEGQLRTTSHPILELVLEAGFSNVGHAYELFRRRYGLSPRRYRVTHRKVIV